MSAERMASCGGQMAACLAHIQGTAGRTITITNKRQISTFKNGVIDLGSAATLYNHAVASTYERAVSEESGG